MERNNNGIGSLAGAFQALAKARATLHIADGVYTRVTRPSGRDAAVVIGAFGRTLQAIRLVGSRKHLNLSVLCGQETSVVEGSAKRPVAVPRLINFVRGGEACFDKIVATIPSAAAFRALRAAGCLPAGAEHDPALPLTLKIDHLPLVDPRWAEPARLARFLRQEANLMAEQKAFKDAGIEPAPAKGTGFTEASGRPFYKEDRTKSPLPAPVEAPPTRVEFGLVDYVPAFKGPERLTPVKASERLRDIERALVSVRLSISLVAIAFERKPGSLAWTDPKPFGKSGKAFSQEVSIGKLVVRCVRTVPIPTAAAAA